MSNERSQIDAFATFLNEKIQSTLEQNLDLSVLQPYHKLLILQSAPVPVTRRLIASLHKVCPALEYVVLGPDASAELTTDFPDVSLRLVPHNKVFQDDDIEQVRALVAQEGADALLFFNNYVNCVDFSNVAHVASFVANDVPVFSFSYVQKELNRHHDLPCQIYGTILYKDLVYWYKTL